VDTAPTAAPAPVTLGEAFKYWLKPGFISFGGPAGQISMMHQEPVEKRRWISGHRYLHALNPCMLLPGPEAIQLAICISWLMRGVKGAIVAIVLFAAWRIGSRALKNAVLWTMAALAFIGIFVFDVAFPWIVLAAGLLGAAGGKLAPQLFRLGGGHGASAKQYGPALIDDDTPAHARFSWK
jgi:chromate transporter